MTMEIIKEISECECCGQMATLIVIKTPGLFHPTTTYLCQDCINKAQTMFSEHESKSKLIEGGY